MRNCCTLSPVTQQTRPTTTPQVAVYLLAVLLLHLEFNVVQIPQNCLDWPHEPFFDNARFTLGDCDQMSDECHPNVRTYACKDVPPAVKLENESPRKADILLEGRDVAAQMKIDAPEEVSKEETR